MTQAPDDADAGRNGEERNDKPSGPSKKNNLSRMKLMK